MMKKDNYQHELVEIGKELPVIIMKANERELLDYFPNETFIPAHWHRSLEIAYLGGIEAVLQVGEKQIDIQDGFTLINSKEVHSIIGKRIEKNAQCIILLFSYDFLKNNFEQFDQVSFDIMKLNKHKIDLKKIVDKLLCSYESNDPYKNMKCNSLLFEMIHFLFSKCQEEEISIQLHNKKEAIEMLDYVHSNYAQELSLQEVANYFHMSKEHFSRKFHEYLGTTFKDYLCSYRLYQAYDDVIHSDESIQDISDKHGFTSVKSFIQFFSRKYHETPLKYRKNINN